MSEKIIEELNQFLEGNYMAIHTYDDYIHRTDDESIKKIFQQIQQEHKHHAEILAERIQNLGGKPVNNPGVKGSVVQWMKKLKPTPGTEEMLKDAIAGEERGIEISQKLLDGDLDEESLAIVKEILSRDKNHVTMLQNLLHHEG